MTIAFLKLSGLSLTWINLIGSFLFFSLISCTKSFDDKMNAVDDEGRNSQISITYPIDDTSLYQEELEIQGKADDNGGINSLEIVLNNQPLKIENISGKWKQKINLKIGENKIIGKMTNSKGDVYRTQPLYVYRLWEKTGDLPNPVAYPAVYFANKSIYILGGWTFQWDFLPAMDNLWSFDPASKQVQTYTPSLFRACYSSNIGFYQDQIFLISGLKKKEGGDYARNNMIDRINYSNGSINPISISIETSTYIRAGSAYGQIDNSVYIIGGIDSDGNTSDIIVKYDLAANQWSTLGALGQPVKFAGSIVYGHKIFIFGGMDNLGNFLKTIYIYDIDNTSVYTFPDRLKYARAGMGAVRIDNKVYLLGGETLNSNGQKEYLDIVEVFNLETQTTLELRKMPAKLGYMGTATDGNKIFIFGGKDKGDFPSKSWIYEYYPAFDNLNQ